MKYLVLVVFLIAVWTLLDQFLRASATEGTSVWGQFKELGRNLHLLVGLIALLIVLIMVARLIYSAFN